MAGGLTTNAVIAFGPELPGIGSWEWVGAETMHELSHSYQTLSFRDDQIPECDVAVIVKYKPPNHVIEQAARRSAVVYCPIDYYGSSAEIDLDGRMLARCSRIIIHCQCLRKYFQSYAPVKFIDHQLRFVTETNTEYRQEGDVLWVGMRTHLPILAGWLRRHPLPAPLKILTNIEAGEPADPPRFGFRTDGAPIVIERWTRERQLELTSQSRCAIDVKGRDFRQRHKPPAKAIDFIASGLPLAMNADSSSVRHLAGCGFDVASVLDWDRWVSREYFEETRRFAGRLRASLTMEQVGRRFQQIIHDVLRQRRRT